MMEEVCRGVARAAWRGSIPLLMIQWLRATSKPGSDGPPLRGLDFFIMASGSGLIWILMTFGR